MIAMRFAHVSILGISLLVMACEKEVEPPTNMGNPGTDPSNTGYCIVQRINNDSFEPLTVFNYDENERIHSYVEFDRYTGDAMRSYVYSFHDSAGVVAIDSLITYGGDVNNGGGAFEYREFYYDLIANVPILDSADVYRFFSGSWHLIGKEYWDMSDDGQRVEWFYREHDVEQYPSLYQENHSIQCFYDNEGRINGEDHRNHQEIVTSWENFELSPYLNPKAQLEEVNPLIAQAKRFAFTKLTFGGPNIATTVNDYIITPNNHGYVQQIDHILTNGDTVAWNLYEYDCHD